jgi:hypothetical protein
LRDCIFGSLINPAQIRFVAELAMLLEPDPYRRHDKSKPYGIQFCLAIKDQGFTSWLML